MNIPFAPQTLGLHRTSANCSGGFPAALCIPMAHPLSCILNAAIAGSYNPCYWKQNLSSKIMLCKAKQKPRIKAQIKNDSQLTAAILQSKISKKDVDNELHKTCMEENVGVTCTIEQMVNTIKSMLNSMEGGAITVSPYDTAWVAMVEDIGGTGRPQFPESLDWIARNQFDDGSWGDTTFLLYDRIIHTLGCIIALQHWDMHQHHHILSKGLSFLKKNIHLLDHENSEHMLMSFEIALTSSLEVARKKGIDLPYDSPGLQKLYARRDIKFSKIPRDIMHRVPSTLLYSLEGMPGLIWEKLLRLQCVDGSFLSSPSSTAFALQQTKNEKCLNFLDKLVRKFDGGVPHAYPMDLFEHLWVVDKLQRLGVARYFQTEIQECIDYVHRYWTDKGIGWARNSVVQDIDDTAMGFRLLRLFGYDVSADVFKNFIKDGEFFCLAEQSENAVSVMYNFYRASQLMIPGESVLEQGKIFARKFLQEKRANNQLLDRWIICKDLPGEVGYALDVPWYASLPRLETRFYLDQYGGEDVWIAKCLYRMPLLNNNTYLELAKLDYKSCQELHQREWSSILEWYKDWSLQDFGLNQKSLLEAYFIATANIFEPHRSQARLCWAKTAALWTAIRIHFARAPYDSPSGQHAFVSEFVSYIYDAKDTNLDRPNDRLVEILLENLNQLSPARPIAHGQDGILQPLHYAWEKCLRAWGQNDEMGACEAELLVQTINMNSNFTTSDDLHNNAKCQQLCNVTNRLCNNLRLLVEFRQKYGWRTCVGGVVSVAIESGSKELVELLFSRSEDGPSYEMKQNFLAVTRSFYYAAHFDHETIQLHAHKVLFENVL